MENSGEEGKITNTTRFTLERRHQLVDLNKEYVNFEIFFECKSLDASKDFEMLVINQDQLDSVDLSTLAMKRTRGGYISGNIVADEDKYQNYFLVMRAVEGGEPLDVDLTISIKPIPPNKDKLRQVACEQAGGNTEQEQNTQNQLVNTPLPCNDPKTPCPMKKIYVILVLVAVAGVVAYLLYRKKKSGNLSHDDPLETASVGSIGNRSDRSASSTSSSKSILKELIMNKKSS